MKAVLRVTERGTARAWAVTQVRFTYRANAHELVARFTTSQGEHSGSACRKPPPIVSTRYVATRETGAGTERAGRYVTGLFAAFDKVGAHVVLSRRIPAEFGVDGYFFRHEPHFVYRRRLSDGGVGIVTILHERMHQIDRFREDFGL